MLHQEISERKRQLEELHQQIMGKKAASGEPWRADNGGREEI